MCVGGGGEGTRGLQEAWFAQASATSCLFQENTGVQEMSASRNQGVRYIPNHKLRHRNALAVFLGLSGNGGGSREVVYISF